MNRAALIEPLYSFVGDMMIDFDRYYKISDNTNIKITIRKTKTQYVVEVGRWSDPVRESYGNVYRGSRTGYLISRLYVKDIVEAHKRAEKAFLVRVIGRCPNCKEYPDIKMTSGRYKVMLTHNAITCPIKLESYQTSIQNCVDDWKDVKKGSVNV